ncbi:hypothetical protein BASA61_009456 [Batrachochytrium salamandrivorans]|nr:hypothetical protein BASA61_009456 [Batrachochytrium salamandrivorans]KAH9273634.1 hypothetical protein BASA83_003965 [Batrachochytrium salamandrivorans]
MKVAVALIYAIATAPIAMAWGIEAHEVIGMIATSFLSSRGLRLVRQLIPGNTLAGVSSWASAVKTRKQYSFTKKFHYIDTRDNPPRDCSFSDERDCKDGKCLVGAIAKYTRQFQCSKKKSELELGDALKFLVHFIGDLSQPLHTSGRDNGGHDLQVRYGDITTSLHSIIDDHIPKQRIKRDFGGDVDRYADYLIDRIKEEEVRGAAAYWLSDRAILDVNIRGNSLAAMEWAAESNAIACSAIWSAYYYNPTQDFSDYFYKNVQSTVDHQLAKAGYRLAFWINRLAGAMWEGDLCVVTSEQSLSTPYNGISGLVLLFTAMVAIR